jgi:hypothetical protein
VLAEQENNMYSWVDFFIPFIAGALLLGIPTGAIIESRLSSDTFLDKGLVAWTNVVRVPQ